MSVLDKIKNEIVESMSIQEMEEALEKKQYHAMKNLEGKRIIGFLLSLRKDSSHGRYYHHIFADKSIKGERCLIKLGKVYNLDDAKQSLLEKLKDKINKDSKYMKFME